jgi:hypothetical protein
MDYNIDKFKKVIKVEIFIKEYLSTNRTDGS